MNLVQGFYLCELAEGCPRPVQHYCMWPDLFIPSDALQGVDTVSEQPGNAKEYASMSVLTEKSYCKLFVLRVASI